MRIPSNHCPRTLGRYTLGHPDFLQQQTDLAHRRGALQPDRRGWRDRSTWSSGNSGSRRPPGVREPARRTPAYHCRSGVAGVGATIRGHLPEIAARRVRSGLPAPPPSPPDARTPGSRGANSAFFFEFQVIAADLGRVPKKTRRGRGKAAASVQRIVSRTGFRGPGLGASADSGGRRFGLRNPERSTGSRCAYASRHPRYPGVIPCYPGYKTFDRAQGGDHCVGRSLQSVHRKRRRRRPPRR